MAATKSSSNSFVTNTSSRTPFAVVESYKNLRTNIISVLSKNGGKVLAITSPNAAEGKSTTALNIAITLSQLSKKVIIVDADTRHSTIHKKLKVENTIGCTDYLLGEKTLDEVTVKNSEYLDVITAGSRVKNSAELFSGRNFATFIGELEEKYDFVVFDTPPINLVSDTLVLAQQCDSVIMVVRANSTKYDAFEAAYESLNVLDIRLDGIIINGSGSEKSYGKSYYKYGKHYYRYSYYGSHDHDESEKKDEPTEEENNN